jgi:hypothetical protein
MRARASVRLGSTGYQPVLSGNLPDNFWIIEKPVGKLPTGTGKLPVLPTMNPRPMIGRNQRPIRFDL